MHFLAKGVAKMYGCRAAEKKKIEETLSKLDANHFCQRNYFGTPLYTTCKSNEAGDKSRSLRNKGRSWYEGGGEGQIQGGKG